MINPDQNVDIRSEAEDLLIQLIQNQKPSKRLAGALAASNDVAQHCKDAILRAKPGISAQEVNLLLIKLNYGRKMADNVRNFLAGNR